MNHINKIRDEVQEFFNANNSIAGSEETILSPSGDFSVMTKSYKQSKPNCNWDVTKIEIFENATSKLLFSFFVNDGIFFHSWVTKENIEYLLCAEDLCGGQTIIDLTNKKMSSYTEDDDGFIWTKHILSPDKSLLAVFGCVWGTPHFINIYHFENPLDLPLKISSEPKWTGYDIVDWIDNKNIKVKKSENEETILQL